MDIEIVKVLISIAALIVTGIGVLVSIKTYRKAHLANLKCEPEIGPAINSATFRPVYGFALIVSNNGDQAITIQNVLVNIGAIKLRLLPSDKHILPGESQRFTFAPSEGQMRYFRNESERMHLELENDKVFFFVSTNKKAYRINAHKTSAEIFAEFDAMYTQDDEGNE